MIDEWVDLAYSDDSTHGQYNELKAWLRSQTQDSETVISATSHPLEMLRAALQAAVYEMRDNLDEHISMLVIQADSFHIEVRQGDYYRTRADDWDSMLPTDIDEMSIQECVGLLYAAKEEIAWLLNEISRLQCYIMVERQMQRAGETERSTVLRPLPRKRTKQTKQTGNGGEQIKEESPILESADSGWSAYNGRSASVELPGHF